MSETNDGGFAERGNKPGTAGGVAQPGGSNTSSGGTGGNSSKSGKSKSDKSAGTTATVKKSNVVSTYGELLPGARAPVVPGFGYTPRRDQTLQDIQEQNRIGNQNYANSQSGSNSDRSVTSSPLGPLPKRPPIPGVKPVRPVTTTPPTETPVDPNFDPNWSRPEGEWGYPGSSNFDNFQGLDGVSGSIGGPGNDLGNTYPGGGQNTTRGGVQGPQYAGRALGGPVGPGQFTVGENGPETLRLGPGSGGAVIPNNPADRAQGMMDPARRQAMVAALQGRFNGGGPGGGPGLTGMGGMPRPAPATPPPRPMMPPPGGSFGAPRSAPMPGPGGPAPRPLSGWQG